MNFRKIISAFFLIAWCIILIEVLVLKQLPLIRVGHMRFHFGGTQAGNPNYIPFKTILFYLRGSNGFLIGAINILGNIGLLIPIGFLLPILFKNIKQLHISLIAFLLGISIELTQAILHIGIFDIDDVILNALGVIIGFASYLRYANAKNAYWRKFIQIIFTLPIVCFILFSIYYYIQNQSFPIAISSGDTDLKPAQLNKHTSLQNNTNCCDLCGGTGGIGKIVAITKTGFDLQRKDGLILHVNLKSNASIKSNQGTITLSKLSIGDPVTLVGDAQEDNRFLAAFVFVCQKSQNQSN